MMPIRLSENAPFGLTLYPLLPKQVYEDLPVDELRDMVRRMRLVVLRGFSSRWQGPGALARYAAYWGDILPWPCGPTLDVREDKGTADQIFDHRRVPLHWDGMFREAIPEFQIFRCVHVSASDEGGRTLFFDTVRLLHDVEGGQLDAWKDVAVTYRIAHVAHYGGEVRSPLLVPHPVSGVATMRYNEPASEYEDFLNRHSLEYHGIQPADVPAFQRELHAALHDKRYRYAHRWEPGDIVIADNFSLLHGREAFRERSGRHLQRVHIQATPVHLNCGLVAKTI
jgi:alpha-ketoglutarate-dependent taurine dioxygenase